jgi:glyoxylase-like metal-dependent hydrolase (beta-lactamase superfamily II)
MTADLTWLLLAPGRAIRTRQNKHLPAEWVDVPTHAVLVDTPDGKLLWDTSCPRDWETHWAPTGLQDFFPYEKVSDEEYLDSRLKQIGVAPGDIDYVVLSHLHFDHAGNVKLFKETNARLVCSAWEKEWAFGFDGPLGASYGPPAVAAAIVNNLEQFYSSVEKVRDVATEANATVVFGHDADQIQRLRTAPEGSYR